MLWVEVSYSSGHFCLYGNHIICCREVLWFEYSLWKCVVCSCAGDIWVSLLNLVEASLEKPTVITTQLEGTLLWRTEGWMVASQRWSTALGRGGCWSPAYNRKDAWAWEAVGWRETRGSVSGKLKWCLCVLKWSFHTWWGLGLEDFEKSGCGFPHTDAKQVK